MENQPDNRPKFEEMSGFKEIERSEKEDFAEKTVKNLLLAMEIISDVLRKYIVPLVVRIAIILLIINMVFFISDSFFCAFKLAFLVVLCFYESGSW